MGRLPYIIILLVFFKVLAHNFVNASYCCTNRHDSIYSENSNDPYDIPPIDNNSAIKHCEGSGKFLKLLVHDNEIEQYFPIVESVIELPGDIQIKIGLLIFESDVSPPLCV